VSDWRKIVLGLAALLVAGACALLIAGLWAGIVVGLAAIVAAGAAVWPLIAAQPKALSSPEVQVPDWVIERPAELAQVEAALFGDPAGTVGITTALRSRLMGPGSPPAVVTEQCGSGTPPAGRSRPRLE
jgi:hypothetical protein